MAVAVPVRPLAAVAAGAEAEAGLEHPEPRAVVLVLQAGPLVLRERQARRAQP